MKKQKLSTISLKFDKTNIANLNHAKGGAVYLSNELTCNTKVLNACHTVTTRPDSIDM